MAHPGGRPSKLETARTTRFLEAIRSGLNLEAACGQAGFTRTTAYRWIEQGKEAKEGKFREFWNQYDEACCAAEALFVERLIKVGMTEDPRWIAWLLERRHPERYSFHVRSELSGPGGQPIALNATAVQRVDFVLSDQAKAELEQISSGIQRRVLARLKRETNGSAQIGPTPAPGGDSRGV